MPKAKIIYEEKKEITARYHNGTDWLLFMAAVKIKDGGKNPISIDLKFKPPYPFAAPMPKEEQKIQASSVMDLFSKLRKWFNKSGYSLQ